MNPNQKPSATRHANRKWELQATDIMHTNVIEFAKRDDLEHTIGIRDKLNLGMKHRVRIILEVPIH